MTNDSNGRRRVVITGMGTITPLGHTVEDTWAGLVAGRSGIGWLTSINNEGYPVKVVGEIKDFDPQPFMDRKDARRMARFSQLAVTAAQEATAAAGLKPGAVDPERVGVLLGNGIGGLPNTEQAMRTIVEKGGMRIDPFFMLKMLPNMAASHLSMRHQAKGYSSTISTACAASTQAMGEAARVTHGRWRREISCARLRSARCRP